MTEKFPVPTKTIFQNTLLTLYRGDITKQAVDAIVNAANSSLLGGGGVDGAIHRAAGKGLLDECRMLHSCKTGDAKITGGYDLPAKHIIHAVGPVYGRGDAADLLKSAYHKSLEVAHSHGLRTIAFPAISTGAYGYPLEEAAPIALHTVLEYAAIQPVFDEVRFVLFTEPATSAFATALDVLVQDYADLCYVE